ncbi:hypothetical protein D3C76_1742180 [compost metagenome]
MGYYFEPDYDLSFERNQQRQGKDKVAEVGIKSTLNKLQIPTYEEGFDELYLVRSSNGSFEVEEMAMK